MDSGKDRVEIALDYPIEVEAILNISFNHEGFKMIFDFILEVLRRHESNLKDHSSKLSSNDISELLKNLKITQALVETHEEKHETNDSKLQSLEKSQFKTDENQKSLEKSLFESNENQKSLLERVEVLEKGQSSQQEIINLHENNIQDILSKLDHHQAELSKQYNIIDSFRQDIDTMASTIDRIERTVTDVREKSDQHSSKLNDHEKRLYKLESDIQQTLKAIKSLGGEIEEISKPVEHQPVENNLVDGSKLDELSDSLRDALRRLSEFEARIRGCEENSSKAKQFSEKADLLGKNNENEIKRLEELIRRIDSKTRNSTNKNENDSPPHNNNVSNESIESLKKSIKQLQELVSDKCSSDELQKMYQEIVAKIDSHGIRIVTLENNMNKKVSKADLDDIMKLINNRQVAKVDDSIDSSKLSAINRRLGFIEETLKFLVLPEGYDLISITNILIKVQTDTKEIKDKVDKSWKELWTKIKEIEDSLNKKAGLDKLKELEDYINKKLKELFDECIAKFSDKIETKRALRYLEKLLKETEPTKTIRDGDDAMLARKPLGGWSCASCQKDLEKLMGKIAPYQAWNKLPYRDPADRIARAGPGFSRMLATVQPDQFTNRNRPTAFNQSPPHSNIEEEINEQVSFPPVKKQAERPFTSL